MKNIIARVDKKRKDPKKLIGTIKKSADHMKEKKKKIKYLTIRLIFLVFKKTILIKLFFFSFNITK